MWLTFSIIIDLLPGQGLIFFGTEDVVSWHTLSTEAGLIPRSQDTLGKRSTEVGLPRVPLLAVYPGAG